MSPGTRKPRRAAKVKIDIRWLAIANRNSRAGWLPIIEVNGVKFGDTYGIPLGADEALAQAEKLAHEEGAKWLGDYEVTVGPARPPRGASR